jgi:hypothetical protein
MGPGGHPAGMAIVLIRPLRQSLGPEDGFFSIYEESHLLSEQEFLRRLQAGELPKPSPVRVLEGQVLVVTADLWIKFPRDKPGCDFVCKGYMPGVARDDFTSQEQKYIIAFNHYRLDQLD